MKATTIFWEKVTTPLAVVCCLLACDLDDAPPSATPPPSNVLTKYSLPPEVVEEIFTEEVLEVTGSLEPFFDRIRRNGMGINDGNNPPNIYNPYTSGELEGARFRIENDCIYDEKYPAYADSSFGGYLDEILILDREEDVIRASVSYNSLSDTSQYPNGYDNGNGEGIATGKGNDFTIFYKVDRGRFGRIFYQGIWMVSGTFTFGENNQPKLTNVTKCLILLEKDADPDQEMANIGTVRIFRDSIPEWQD